MRTMWNKIQKNKIETHVCNSVCLHTSPKLDKLLVGIGDLEVAKTCTLPYNMLYTNPWMLVLGHYSGCTYTFANDIMMTYLNYHNASLFFRWFVFWIMPLFLTRCIATFFIYHVIVNIIIKFNMKKKNVHIILLLNSHQIHYNTCWILLLESLFMTWV